MTRHAFGLCLCLCSSSVTRYPDLGLFTGSDLPADLVPHCPAVTNPGLSSGLALPADSVSYCLVAADCCSSPGAASIPRSGANLFLQPVPWTVTTTSTHLQSGHHQPAATALVPRLALTLSVPTFRSVRREVQERPPHYSSLHQVRDKYHAIDSYYCKITYRTIFFPDFSGKKTKTGFEKNFLFFFRPSHLFYFHLTNAWHSKQSSSL